jgi:hypothetical protein
MQRQSAGAAHLIVDHRDDTLDAPVAAEPHKRIVKGLVGTRPGVPVLAPVSISSMAVARGASACELGFASAVRSAAKLSSSVRMRHDHVEDAGVSASSIASSEP